jgi:outer membrane lipoprotein carrier protein
MRKRGRRIIAGVIVAAAALCFYADAGAYKFQFVTVSDVVKKVRERFGKIESYQASFRLNSEKLGRKTQQSGTVRYKTGNRMIVDFDQPYGQKIVTTGNTMWVYIPSMNVVAEQDLKTQSDSLFSSNTKSGLQRLFSKYHYKFASREQPEDQKDGGKRYTIALQQKESRSGFRTLKLWISEDYLITRAAGETSSGKKVDIEFSNIKTDVDLPNGIFKFDMPSRARVIKNPMIAEE